MSGTMLYLDDTEITTLAPDLFLASLGKRVIRPGGRRATQEILQRVKFQVGYRILDIGCGVGTTAIELARRFGVYVTAADISPLMLDLTRENVHKAGMVGVVKVEKGDITGMKYPDNSFDCAIAEAVTALVDQRAATREMVRVCKPGSPVLLIDFFWRRPPTPEAEEGLRELFGPGLRINSRDEWWEICQDAGLEEIELSSGPFEMISPRGFLRDEGVLNAIATTGRLLTRPAYFKRMTWLLPRLLRTLPYLGYVSLSGVKSQGKTMRARY